MEYSIPLKKLCQIETKRLLLMMGIIATVVLVILSSGLPYGKVFVSLFPSDKLPVLEKDTFANGDPISSSVIGGISPLNNSDLSDLSVVTGVVNITEAYNIKNTLEENDKEGQDRDGINDFEEEEERSPDDRKFENNSSSKNVLDPDYNSTTENVRNVDNNSTVKDSRKTGSALSPEKLNSSNISSLGEQAPPMLSKDRNPGLLHSDSTSLSDDSQKNSNPIKKVESKVPSNSITTIAEMNHLFLQSRTSFSEISQSSSKCDKELLHARLQIENAPIIKNNQELYAPLFRNISMFKRSYELMEQILKVYIYKEGERPIFHQGPLNGIYASEGWFTRLMEANQQFVTKNPRKAHLFYLPFSSRMLEETLYVPNSHRHTNLVAHLKKYLDTIAAKYPFWNRIGGEDHFLVACHDWAPSETKHHMGQCIRALCNSDINEGFRIGKDVSLPETYVRSAQNPLRDLGGKPPSKRPILAFFAGSMHGYLRPILLQYWNNKDPDMKIFGRMGRGGKRKMNYIQHMKSSKYCICAKGYEVNSPRVVESIFYDCVPVIISDNFVPPFFEILDWKAFAVFVAEKDIPNLKNILLSIPYKKYLMMQKRVKKVQQHFLWHTKPVRYDIFHMILHSVWYNRVFQIGLNK